MGATASSFPSATASARSARMASPVNPPPGHPNPQPRHDSGTKQARKGHEKGMVWTWFFGARKPQPSSPTALVPSRNFCFLHVSRGHQSDLSGTHPRPLFYAILAPPPPQPRHQAPLPRASASETARLSSVCICVHPWFLLSLPRNEPNPDTRNRPEAPPCPPCLPGFFSSQNCRTNPLRSALSSILYLLSSRLPIRVHPRPLVPTIVAQITKRTHHPSPPHPTPPKMKDSNAHETSQGKAPPGNRHLHRRQLPREHHDRPEPPQSLRPPPQRGRPRRRLRQRKPLRNVRHPRRTRLRRHRRQRRRRPTHPGRPQGHRPLLRPRDGRRAPLPLFPRRNRRRKKPPRRNHRP